MAGAVGSATIDFGTGAGSQIASVAVTGQTAISSTSAVEAFLMGNDSTADNTDYQHRMAVMAISFVATAIVAGTGFTINALSDWQLRGTYKVRWVWSD